MNMKKHTFSSTTGGEKQMRGYNFSTRTNKKTEVITSQQG